MLSNSRQRIIDHGEVFTPPGLVDDMLDLVKHECERIDSRFLEPACGDGNFLAEVLRRKLLTVEKTRRRFPRKWERDAVLCVCSLYGIELLFDNVIDCRTRLLTVVEQTFRRLFTKPLQPGVVRSVHYILSRNIVQADALDMRTLDRRPIVFSEWSPVNFTHLKRRDFAYAHLLDKPDVFNLSLSSDSGREVFIPTSVGEFPPCHYLKVADAKAGIEHP